MIVWPKRCVQTVKRRLSILATIMIASLMPGCDHHASLEDQIIGSWRTPDFDTEIDEPRYISIVYTFHEDGWVEIMQFAEENELPNIWSLQRYKIENDKLFISAQGESQFSERGTVWTIEMHDDDLHTMPTDSDMMVIISRIDTFSRRYEERKVTGDNPIHLVPQ